MQCKIVFLAALVLLAGTAHADYTTTGAATANPASTLTNLASTVGNLGTTITTNIITGKGASAQAVSSPAPAPGGKAANVAQATILNPDLTTLVTVASALPGTIETLSNPDLIATIFAPTDSAFAQLLSLLNLTAEQVVSNQELLRTVLSYHIVPGVAATAADLTNFQQLPTQNDGQTITVLKSADGSVSLKPSGYPIGAIANVVQADIPAGKAIVHVIDAVLVPQNAIPGELGAVLGNTLTGGAPTASPAAATPTPAPKTTSGAASTGAAIGMAAAATTSGTAGMETETATDTEAGTGTTAYAG